MKRCQESHFLVSRSPRMLVLQFSPGFQREPARYGAPFVYLLFISLLAFIFVICSFIYDNVISDRPFSQITNFTIIGYLRKPFLYPLVI